MSLTVKDILSLFPDTSFEGDVNQEITGASLDSRTISKGDLFVAIAGENFDGHKFIEDVLSKGASLILASDNKLRKQTLQCSDVVEAFGKIAHAYRQRFKGTVIGITGSSGKTTTKELLNHVLSQFASIQATKGNFNNHLGVPLSILNFDLNANVWIVEMGMSALGEIADLSQIAAPSVGLITSVGPAHIEGVGGKLENVATAKGELFLALSDKQTAIVNADDPFICMMPTDAQKISYGLTDGSIVQAKELNVSDGTTHFEVHYGGQVCETHLRLVGTHHVQNALGVIATGLALEFDFQGLCQALQSFALEGNRGKIHKNGSWILVDDTYNANPASMKAAFESLKLQFPTHGRIAVLGDMLELGSNAEDWHKEVGEEAKVQEISNIYTYGALSKSILKGFGYDEVRVNEHHFDDHEKLAQHLKTNLNAEEKLALLFKGSRSMMMEKALQPLCEDK